ncbi:hypothetical protein PG993_008763 [Apiospora rasikravindrae]|uniref:Uncharacterized protein n=1 Tax=Apiospora rasikravindrae TaxID=990691 RepID=A0ABR1SP84_9PEZI
MSSSGRKSPKRWTEEEDALLYHEFTRLSDPNEITDWSRIAEGVPGRSNKDCRKRWVNKVCGGLNKGPWSREEDQRLRKAMEVHGSKWTRVSEEVASRSADQCAKRWQQSLDPNIKHGNWTEEEDGRLIRAVEKHGRQWKQIQENYYQSRSRNDLKNRYTIITRRASNSDTAASQSTSGFLDTGETTSLPTTSSTFGATPLAQDEYAVDYSHPKPFAIRPAPQPTLDSADYWRPAPQDTMTSWSSSYAMPMTSTFSDPPGIMSWNQQVPANLQGALDGQYYPAEDTTSVHDPYYQNPMNDMSGGSMDVGGGNNNYGGGIPPLTVDDTTDLDDGTMTDYDRNVVYNPFMYNAQ